VKPRTDPASVSTFISESLRRRADLLGVKRRSAEFSVQSKAAKNLLLPQLDLTVRTGYSGLRIGRSLGDYAIAPFQGVQGEDIIGGITFSFPPANHFARGQVIQTEASARQNLIRVGDTERSITAAVLTAVNDVAASRERLRSAGDSVEAFQRALQGERDKFSLGLNAIVDVLTIEDRLTQALTNQVNAQLSYALALVEFRFATGTIIDPNSQTHTIDRDTFVTLPQAILHYTSP
jgi:outer membrane protein TolC